MRTLLITPPFVQMNTPYPATPQLQAFLRGLGVECRQADLSLELLLALFSPAGLRRVLETGSRAPRLDAADRHLLSHGEACLAAVAPVIAFLQGREPQLAHRICAGSLLPVLSPPPAEIDDFFGSMAVHDRARYLASHFLADLGAFITRTVDPDFGLSRYAERLAAAAPDYAPLRLRLQQAGGLLDDLLQPLLARHLDAARPDLVALTVPFPGNLYFALRLAGLVKAALPQTQVALGGGYVSTELRSLREPALFDSIDYLIFDDGEAPLQALLRHLQEGTPVGTLKRTLLRTEAGTLHYADGSGIDDYEPDALPAPDYSGLPLDCYLPVLEAANPMQNLWNNGRWNKLTLAHGCYWRQCSFCDTSLDYICRFKPGTPARICDKIEDVIRQTGSAAFHFTDEAAPPALLKGVALEILRRGLTPVWWTNVRFEPAFSLSLCRLLQAAGCIAVAGGLETAEGRLLQKINKGVTLPEAVRSLSCFAEAGIMVHAYLMYGVPGQTLQETVDALEVVRQLFTAGWLHSAFWHRFALTVHSPAGREPERFGVRVTGSRSHPFANNELAYAEPEPACPHAELSTGLHRAVYNYMHGVCLDQPLRRWFELAVPSPRVRAGYVQGCLENVGDSAGDTLSRRQLIFLGSGLRRGPVRGGRCRLFLAGPEGELSMQLEPPLADYYAGLLPTLRPQSPAFVRLTVEEFLQECAARLGSADSSRLELAVLAEAGLISV